MANLADNTAAVAAGYARVQIDRGAAQNPRYVTRYEKPMVGGTGEVGFLQRAEGVSNSSQGAADTAALTVLNAQREDRRTKDSAQGGAHTVDVN